MSFPSPYVCKIVLTNTFTLVLMRTIYTVFVMETWDLHTRAGLHTFDLNTSIITTLWMISALLSQGIQPKEIKIITPYLAQ